MADKKGRYVIDDVRGGRNGYDPPWAIANNECADAVNVDFYGSRLGHKRRGTAAVTVTGAAYATTAADSFKSLFRHVPGTDDTLAELWTVDGGNVIGRMAATTSIAAVTVKDAPSGNAYEFSGSSINAKFVLGYQSATARLHLWDKSTLRRAGLAATVAPTAADGGGGGAYAAVLRYYRQRSTRQSGGVTIGRSEASPSVSFTPSGANLNATVTQAAVINEGETHWEVEASLDNVTFYRIATVLIATTTYADSAATTTYNTNPLSASTGIYTLQKPYKFVAADQNRVLGFGSYTATDKQHRVEFSAVIGSLDIGDEERVDTTVNSYIDLDEQDSGIPTGLLGPILGSFFAFKSRQIWRLTATGSTSQPFRAECVSKSVGALPQVSGTSGEDADGNPCLYWMSHRGPYRWGLRGLEYIGRGIEDLILGPTSTLNVSAVMPARVVYHSDLRQVWWWIATGSAQSPTIRVAYDVMSGGWSRVDPTDAISACVAAVMFANTLGASMSLDLKPYFGDATANAPPKLRKGDTGTDDLGAGYKAYITTKAVEPGGPGFYGTVGDAIVLASAAAGVTLTDTVTADFGLQTRTGTALLTASGSESRVQVRLENSALSGAQFIQHQIGDAAAVTTGSWNLDRLVVPYTKQEGGSG